MIRGLDLFRGHFAEYRKAFVLIGGVACHEWLSTQGLEFRATKDMDMVLIVEAVDTAFVKRFWEFIEAGKYAGRFKADDDRQLYRFDKPADDKYPVMIEIFSRKPSNVDLAEGQQVVPIKLDADSGDHPRYSDTPTQLLAATAYAPSVLNAPLSFSSLNAARHAKLFFRTRRRSLQRPESSGEKPVHRGATG